MILRKKKKNKAYLSKVGVGDWLVLLIKSVIPIVFVDIQVSILRILFFKPKWKKWLKKDELSKQKISERVKLFLTYWYLLKYLVKIKTLMIMLCTSFQSLSELIR